MKRLRWIDRILIVAALVTGAVFASKPWQIYQQEKSRSQQARRSLNRAEAEQARLAAERTRLESPLGREQAAREAGYRRPNEVPVNP